MILPPLTADASLYRSMAHYRSSWPAGNTSGIAPSQVLSPGAIQPLALTQRQKCIILVAGICAGIGTVGALGALAECVPLCAASGPGFLVCEALCAGLEQLILATGACVGAASL